MAQEESFEWDLRGKPDKVENEVSEIINFLKEYYIPAKSFKEADYTPSTTEFYFLIHNIFPSDLITPESVYRLLKRAGYRFDLLPDSTNLLWLMIKKK